MKTSNSSSKLPAVVAHRGASGDAPENTIAAFKLAASHGATAVELDVMISSDNIAYVHHDDGLNRCTNGSGYLCSHPSIELDKLIASNKMPSFSDEPLPRFTDVIDVLVENNMALNVEIKPTPGLEIPTAKATCDLLKSKWPKELPLVISSFSREALKPCMDWLPDAPRALIVCAVPDNWHDELKSLDATNLHCAGELLQPAVAKSITSAGFGLYCFTVNNPEKAAELFTMGVDGIFSDYPKKMLDAGY